MRHDDVNFELDQLGGEKRESRWPALRPSVLDSDGLSLDVAEVAQTFPEGVDVGIGR